MERIKELSERITENSERAEKARYYLQFFDKVKHNLMYKAESTIASGMVYKLPYIPYTSALGTELYFTQEDNNMLKLWLINGYIQEVALINLTDYSFNITMPNREEFAHPVKNFIEWLKENRKPFPNEIWL
jgi:hypothetical protein